MALSITHAFVSSKSDGPDATLVRPSNWNAALVTSMATAKILGRATAGAGAVEELNVAVDAAGNISTGGNISCFEIGTDISGGYFHGNAILIDGDGSFRHFYDQDGSARWQFGKASTGGNSDLTANHFLFWNIGFGTQFAGLDSNGLSVLVGSITSISPTAGIGYATGAGGTVTQITSRNTGVTLNKVSGDIVLLSAINAAVSAATSNTVTVTNSAVTINDTINVVQKSGVDKYLIFVTDVAAGSFDITFFTTGGTTNEAPVFHFNVINGVNS